VIIGILLGGWCLDKLADIHNEEKVCGWLLADFIIGLLLYKFCGLEIVVGLIGYY